MSKSKVLLVVKISNLNKVKWSMHTAHCTLYIVHCTLYTYIVHCTLYTYIVHCTLDYLKS